MNNIFKAWAEFSSIQQQAIKGPMADQLLGQIESQARNLKGSEYPTGEDWRYVKYGQLPRTSLRWPEAGEKSKQVADGDFLTLEIWDFHNPQKIQVGPCPEGLTVLSQLEAYSEGRISNKKLSFSFENPFFDLADSFLGQGLFIEFDSNFKFDKGIQLIFKLSQFDTKDLLCPFQIDIVSRSSHNPQVFLDFDCETFCGLSNVSIKAQIEENAELSLFSKERGGPQSHNVLNILGEVAGGGHFQCMDMTFPNLWSRHNIDVRLLDQHAEVSLEGAYLNHRDFFTDHHTSIRHTKGRTTSLEDYRGILGGHAKAVFNGKILIDEKAARSQSEQLNKNLMLSKTAEVDTKPELQIYNDDVKAAHGATVGQIDPEQQFYLQSRGYSDEEATQVLAKAFVHGLLDSKSENVKQFFSDDIDRALLRLGDQ